MEDGSEVVDNRVVMNLGGGGCDGARGIHLWKEGWQRKKVGRTANIEESDKEVILRSSGLSYAARKTRGDGTCENTELEMGL